MIDKGMLTQGSLISQQLGPIADVVTHVVRIVLVLDESYYWEDLLAAPTAIKACRTCSSEANCAEKICRMIPA